MLGQFKESCVSLTWDWHWPITTVLRGRVWKIRVSKRICWNQRVNEQKGDSKIWQEVTEDEKWYCQISFGGEVSKVFFGWTSVGKKDDWFWSECKAWRRGWYQIRESRSHLKEAKIMPGFTTAVEADNFSENYNFNLNGEIVERTATKVKSTDGNFKETMYLRIARWEIGKRCKVTENWKVKRWKKPLTVRMKTVKFLVKKTISQMTDSSFDSDHETDFASADDKAIPPNKVEDTHFEPTIIHGNGGLSQIFFQIIWEENYVDQKGQTKSSNSKIHGPLGSNCDITQNGESVICSSHQQLAPATFKVTMSHSFDAEVALADESIFDKLFKRSIFDESVMSDTCLAG